jgi:quercetin dioxygenase-like cupin family protein
MKARILRAAQRKVQQMEWGSLTWFASRELGNSESLTVGQCVIRPGCANPRHLHPNCEEILTVAHGRIAHAIEDGKEVEMNEGDTITIPIGLGHNARNVGDTDAVLLIAFSSADRKTQGE